MLNQRLIRGRIKSVKNTRKITKAMELVAASKMRKAVATVLATRPYAKLSWDTVLAISKVVDVSKHPLLKADEKAKKDLLLLFTSDRGLAGGFNINIIKKAENFLQTLDPTQEIDVITIGKRGTYAMRKLKRNVIASFHDLTTHPLFEETFPLGRLVVEDFLKGVYKNVFVVYTDFISAINQKPNMVKLLPLKDLPQTKSIGEIETKSDEVIFSQAKEYTFEPNPFAVLDRLLPRLVETMIYQALLESSASEQSARMMSMHSASDAATDMIDSLTFSYNQARQASITREIAEISSGKAALE